MNSIKRALQVLINERGLELGVEQSGMDKPEGTDVKRMFAAGPEVFQCGAEKLPEGSHHLRVENMIGMHVESCQECSKEGRLGVSCYFYNMIRCIMNGWKVPIEAGKVKAKYKVKSANDKNYGSVGQYNKNFEEEFEKMKANGVLRKAEAGFAKVVSPTCKQYATRTY